LTSSRQVRPDGTFSSIDDGGHRIEPELAGLNPIPARSVEPQFDLDLDGGKGMKPSRRPRYGAGSGARRADHPGTYEKAPDFSIVITLRNGRFNG